MVRVAKLLASYGLKSLQVIRAKIAAAVGNENNIWAAEKIGAHYERILLNHMVVGRAVYDVCMYSLIPSDFRLSVQLG